MIGIGIHIARVTGFGPDTTLPEFLSAEVGDVSASTLVITMSKLINASVVPADGDFSVSDGEANAVTDVSISGNSVTLTLTNAVEAGDTVTVAYTKGANALQDLSANEADSWTAEAVTNNVGSGIWRDSDNSGVWDDSANSGVWDDNA